MLQDLLIVIDKQETAFPEVNIVVAMIQFEKLIYSASGTSISPDNRIIERKRISCVLAFFQAFLCSLYFVKIYVRKFSVKNVSVFFLLFRDYKRCYLFILIN